MLQYERKQLNRLIDDNDALGKILKSAIDGTCEIIEHFVEEKKQQEALNYFTKKMISPETSKEQTNDNQIRARIL